MAGAPFVIVTSSTHWTLGADHVSPGTHLACMGTYTLGKQEVAPMLLSPARIFTDEPVQSVTLGEAQPRLWGLPPWVVVP